MSPIFVADQTDMVTRQRNAYQPYWARQVEFAHALRELGLSHQSQRRVAINLARRFCPTIHEATTSTP